MLIIKKNLSLKAKIAHCLVCAVCLVSSAVVSAAVETRQIEFWNDFEPSSLIDLDHSPFSEILNKYVISDHPSGIARFNYEAVTEADYAKLERYLDFLQIMEPRQLTQAEAKAYWINLYNAATLRFVVKAVANGRASKIRARGLPARRWRQKIITISEQRLSLEDIMHGVIRPMYNDRRVHYALFFCTLGGADMPKEAFDGDNNEALLTSLETSFLQHSRAVRIEGDSLMLSEIFKQYDTDFATNRRDLIEYLKQRVPDPVAQAMSGVNRIRYDYDETVNAP